MMKRRGEETDMRVRRPRTPASVRLGAPARGIALAVTLLAAAGCGSPAAKSQGGAASPAGPAACGTTRTAANVPVHVQVVRGQVSCAIAMQVERDYAKAILAGKVPGTGGGAPVQVHGWTCQGFATPVVLKTGQASKCVQGGKEIRAVLPAPT
jgi:hypothetical protein